MKKYTIKMKHVLMVLAIGFTCMFSLSSCFTILSAIEESKDKRTDAQKTYDMYRYHFMAEAPSGQMLCFVYMDSLNVSCVTPDYYRDPATGESTKYKLSGDVIIPKTVSNGGKTYNVSALESRDSYYWHGEDITNLVIPPSIKRVGRMYLNDNLKNVIVYASDNIANSFKAKVPEWLHVPREVNYLEYGWKERLVKIVDGYDIYEKGHSLDEYLRMAQSEIDQAIMIKTSQ